VSDEPLRPFFSFYGAKWRAVPSYPPPTHDMIVEPFAGSASYSVRFPSRRILLVDIDECICGVWRYLIRVSAAELLRLPDLAPDQTVDDIDAPQEARWLMGFWLNNGSSTPKKRASRSAKRTVAEWAQFRGAPRPLFWGTRVRERLASQVEQIRHWKVVHADYRMAPDIEATWFVDPPYEGAAGKHYRYRVDDYGALGSWCRGLRGQTVVCEGRDAAWLPFSPLGLFRSNASRTGRSHAAEQVWVRG
jgi:hypothetical protein